MKSQTKKISESFTAMTELVLPNDTNLLGNLMGGNLMRWMDIACGICASRHCEAPTVTVSVDHLTFQEPIKLGDIVTINASVSRTFTTSLEIFVEVFITNIRKKENRKSNQAYFTFVALDERTMRPQVIPQAVIETDEEKKMWEDAAIRRELRLLQSGRIQPSEATLSKNLLNS
ncbi:MAG: acyl-CoA thioesterase [Saprospiraceae bacterium]|nr:acyl-CoA thioesterase [Saprospiraceae bacterium]HMW38088.1 acyl-CoA thioesterase [Saprospiraceae bacterium]HMX87145.1 acyl-CoA thioesterase [Saprospiraceae bacterium]HMZ38775.1 acyl-CoA thioesterase [Saprospiraceae bacterium]HNA63204.1 acyl-CoA thioesterase [Saprospiraceae bacterium]